MDGYVSVVSLLIVEIVGELPCSLGLTGRVHEEECDKSVLMYCFKSKE